MRYGRWIVLGLLVVAVVVVWVLVSANKNLRQRLEAFVLERFVRNKVQDLREKAAVARAQAERGEIDASDAERAADELQKQVVKQKADLAVAMEQRGLDADEIAARICDLTL